MTCTAGKPVIITQGEDRVLDCKIRKQNGDPFDLTGASAIAKFKKADGTILQLSSAVSSEIQIDSPAVLGRLKIFLNDTMTALLKVGEGLDFEVQVTVGPTTLVVLFAKSITVRKQLA